MKYIKIEVTSNLKAPFFIGSMIRGALGNALKDIVCINPSFNCSDCFAKDNCLYYEFYEEKNRFLNYRLDYTLSPKKVDFNIYLFNDAISKYPYILSAIEKLFTQKGLGVKRETTKDFKIYIDNNLIYDKEFKNIQIEPKEPQLDSYCQVLKLKLVTPLRLKRAGRFLKPDNLDIKDILISILGKKAFFENSEKEHIEQFPTVVMKDLKFIDLTRYSNRQKTKMKIGGVVGEMIISNLNAQTYNLLKYAELTGVGKLNSFGLGKIEVQKI